MTQHEHFFQKTPENRTEVLSKIKFNGFGGTQTYLSSTHSGFHPSQNINRQGELQ
jgi:hypothetical protein